MAFATFWSLEHGVRNILEFRTWRSQHFAVYNGPFATSLSLEHGLRNIWEFRTWRSQHCSVYEFGKPFKGKHICLQKLGNLVAVRVDIF
jgi:hypothetical protein